MFIVAVNFSVTQKYNEIRQKEWGGIGGRSGSKINNNTVVEIGNIFRNYWLIDINIKLSSFTIHFIMSLKIFIL